MFRSGPGMMRNLTKNSFNISDLYYHNVLIFKITNSVINQPRDSCSLACSYASRFSLYIYDSFRISFIVFYIGLKVFRKVIFYSLINLLFMIDTLSFENYIDIKRVFYRISPFYLAVEEGP